MKHMQGSNEAKAAVHSAIYTALASNTDDAFAALLDAVAAHTSDGKFPLVDTQHPDTGATALMVAAARGRADTVAALLRLGADAGVRANKGMTALDWAERSGSAAAAAAAALREHVQQAAEVDAGAAATAALAAYQAATDQDRVDVQLIERLLRYLYAVGGDTAAGVRPCSIRPGFSSSACTVTSLYPDFSPDAAVFYLCRSGMVVTGADMLRFLRSSSAGSDRSVNSREGR